jgi:hypothetical protein
MSANILTVPNIHEQNNITLSSWKAHPSWKVNLFKRICSVKLGCLCKARFERYCHNRFTESLLIYIAWPNSALKEKPTGIQSASYDVQFNSFVASDNFKYANNFASRRKDMLCHAAMSKVTLIYILTKCLVMLSLGIFLLKLGCTKSTKISKI